MIIRIIVAASRNNVIGKNDQLVWHLPNDAKFFKNTTWGMPVVMGRKTYDSLKTQGLPGRFNFVVTHQSNWDAGNAKVKAASSLSSAIAIAAETDCKEIFIIGGGQLYAEAIDLADRIYMTRVHADLEGDVWFPTINDKLFALVGNRDFPADDKHAYSYSFQVWDRKK